MAAGMSLPEGFVLEEPESSQGALPEGFVLDETKDDGFIDSASDLFTGESRMTPEMESMSEIGDAPELNEMSWSAFKTSLGLLATGDEEKARSVIKSNIPEADFTIDQEGNTIVNLPSGQYALNKPGISGQDIARGIFDIAAFTPAGRAGTIGRAAIGSGATEVGMQSATKAVGGGDATPTDIIQSTVMGGVFKGAEDAIGAGYRAIKGRPSGEVAEVAEFAKSQDVPLMTSDVSQPSTFIGKSAQSAAEKIPVSGTGGLREAQQEARTKLVSDFSSKFGEYKPEDIVESLQRQTSKIKKAAGGARQNIMDQMEGVNVNSQNAIKAIDDEIARLSSTPSGEARATADTATIQKLQDYKADLEVDPSFSNLEQLRTQFRTDVKGDRIVMPNRSEAAINRIYSSMSKDMDESISAALGDQASRKWKQSNAVYASEADKLKNTRLKSVLQKGNLTPEVVNNLIYSNKPSEFKNLYRSLDSKGKSSARAALIGKAIDKSGGSPDKFLNELNRISPKLGVAFKGSDKKFVDGLSKYLDATRQAGRADVTTPTGQQLFQIAVPAGIATDVAMTGGTSLAATLGYGGLARAYESKAVRDAIMRLNSLTKGSTQFEQQLKKVSSLISAAAQASRRAEE